MMGRSKSQERVPVKLRRQTVHQDTMQYLKVYHHPHPSLSLSLSLILLYVCNSFSLIFVSNHHPLPNYTVQILEIINLRVL